MMVKTFGGYSLVTTDQVLALAPDASSAAAGKKLASPGPWKNLGHSPAALWGECQGSALYRVEVDLAGPAYKCSCPSRKFPCKHALGLLLLHAASPNTFPVAAPPDWVQEWLDKRSDSAAKKEAKATAPAEAKPVDAVAQAKRAAKRTDRVRDGVAQFNLWLDDLAKGGLAGLETRGDSVWNQQAARLVDCQAPGLAARVRALAEIPGSGPDWTRRLLARLGRLALLAHAFERLEQLVPALQDDVRLAIGWTLTVEQVAEHGDVAADAWVALCQSVEEEERVRVQRTWLKGIQTGRDALILQFSPGMAPFPETLVPGTVIEATIAYWPSAFPQRAKIGPRGKQPVAIDGPLPGAPTAREFLTGVARSLAQQPWIDRWPCTLCGVTPAPGKPWRVVDRQGESLPLSPHVAPWRMLALSGGGPIDVAGEWNGDWLTPLGVCVDGSYHLLRADA